MKWMPNRFVQLVFLSLLVLVVHTAHATPPWAKLLPFKKVDADPNKEYRLTDENGPWTIMATTFSGEGAREQAHQLVIELRRDFQLPAYIHEKNFDYTGKVTGLGVDKKGGPRKMRYQRAVRYTEYAVMVGDYSSVEDARLEEDLTKVKSIHPRTLDPNANPDGQSNQPLSKLRQFYQQVNLDKREAGPMHRAFVVRNPLIPKEFFVHSGLSPLVLKINEGVKYSLLDNKGKYTVQVATFKGEVHYETELQPEEKQNWWAGLIKRRQPSKLELAAENAHRLTMALRAKGVEAYEFHDHELSIVTVGSFDEVGYRRPDGKLELAPEVYKVMREYGAERTAPGRIQGKSTTVVGSGLVPKQLDGITFDVSPRPIRVPKRPLVR